MEKVKQEFLALLLLVLILLCLAVKAEDVNSAKFIFFDDFEYSSAQEMESFGWRILEESSAVYFKESVVGEKYTPEGGASIRRSFDLPSSFVVEIKGEKSKQFYDIFDLSCMGNIMWIDDNPNEG